MRYEKSHMGIVDGTKTKMEQPESMPKQDENEPWHDESIWV
jgi:hypothetical protein